ncbi:MAG: hypothetical protein KatS3mg108_0690 [Isosphaeraceae bacterium]|nr:MAG: hypothetical protein KatS3mg108_0690 [Isosphaeraceae bacterium]
MKLKSSTTGLLLALVVPLTACVGALDHKYPMRGQILEARGDEVYLCIGAEDGARVGQEYVVYRLDKSYLPPKGMLHLEKVRTGSITITSVLESHMAKAKLDQGVAKEHYVVELNP